MTCVHPPHCVILDEHEGTEICTNCAFVLNTTYIHSEQKLPQNKDEFKTNYLYDNDNDANRRLETLHEKGFIPRNVYKHVMQEIPKYLKKQKDIQKRFAYKDIFAFTVYWTLIKFRLDETPENICKWFNSSIKKLTELKNHFALKQHNVHNYDNVLNPPNFEIYVSRFVSYLKYEKPTQWNIFDKSIILQIIHNLNQQNGNEHLINIRPQTYTVSIIYLYFCYKHQINPQKSPMKTLQYICTICNVSSYNIKKVLKQYLHSIDIEKNMIPYKKSSMYIKSKRF